MNPQKILIITYYWPPTGGSGVQRWLKFVKYLPKYGWQPYVITPENPSFALRDDTLLKDVAPEAEVFHLPIWEPYAVFIRLARLFSKKEIKVDTMRPGGATLMQKLGTFIRGNFLIPDPKVFWVRPTTRFLADFIKEQGIKVIVTSGPPHSLHVIGLRLKNKLSYIGWVADFRDPWTTMDYYKDLKLTRLADSRHRYLEKQVLQKASVVVVIGETMKKEFKKMGARKVVVISNGYDSEDFQKESSAEPTAEFTIVHAGYMVARRNPLALWKAIDALKRENHELINDLKVILVGKLDPTVVKCYTRYNLESQVRYIQTVPHHEVIKYQLSANILLLAIDNFEGSEWVITGKLFEYLAAGRTILGIGPLNGDAAAILSETQHGIMFDFDDVDGIKSYLIKKYEEYRLNKPTEIQNSKAYLYSREVLTKKLVDTLKEI